MLFTLGTFALAGGAVWVYLDASQRVPHHNLDYGDARNINSNEPNRTDEGIHYREAFGKGHAAFRELMHQRQPAPFPHDSHRNVHPGAMRKVHLAPVH